jgi:hypothetical protein
MKLLCSIATAAMIGIGAAASAGEPVRLADESLDRVTAGFLLTGAFSTGFFAIFGTSATISETSESTTTGQDGNFQSRSKASINASLFGPGLVATGGTVGAFGFYGGGANGN